MRVKVKVTVPSSTKQSFVVSVVNTLTVLRKPLYKFVTEDEMWDNGRHNNLILMLNHICVAGALLFSPWASSWHKLTTYNQTQRHIWLLKISAHFQSLSILKTPSTQKNNSNLKHVQNLAKHLPEINCWKLFYANEFDICLYPCCF